MYWIVATGTEVRCMDGVSAKRIGRASFPVGVGVRAKEVGVMRHAGTFPGWAMIQENGANGSLAQIRPRLWCSSQTGRSSRIRFQVCSHCCATPRRARVVLQSRTYTHVPPKHIHTYSCSNMPRLLPDPTSISLLSTGHALIFSQPQGELVLCRLFYEKHTPLPVLRFAPPVKGSKAQGSGILGWISSLSGGGPGKVMSGEEVDTIRMCSPVSFVVWKPS